MNAEKRRKKRLRNLVCIVYCSLQLLIVLALFQGMGSLLHKLVPAGIDLSQIEGKIVAVDDEQENKDKLDENKLIVCLDAGHGGKDNGSDYRLRYEKNDNLKITKQQSFNSTNKFSSVYIEQLGKTFYKGVLTDAA